MFSKQSAILPKPEKTMGFQKLDEAPEVQRKPPGNLFVNLFKEWLDLYIRGNYREFPIVDDNGNIIGYEFCSPRGGSMVRVMSDRGGVKNE